MDDNSFADMLRCANTALGAIHRAHQELGFLEDDGTAEEVAQLCLVKNFVHGASSPLLELVKKLSAAQGLQSLQSDGPSNCCARTPNTDRRDPT